jgi:hypothetical protein
MLTLKAGLLKDEFSFTGTLLDPPPIIVTNISYAPSQVQEVGSPDSFLDWFNGLGGAWSYVKWIIIAAVAVGIILLAGVIVYFAYPWFKSLRETQSYKLVGGQEFDSDDEPVYADETDANDYMKRYMEKLNA